MTSVATTTKFANPVASGCATQPLCAHGKTTTGKANFTAHALPRDTHVHHAQVQAAQLDAVVFTLTTVRSHDQYNTTIYGPDDRYRSVCGQRRVVFINAADLKKIGMQAGDRVDITSLYVAACDNSMQRRCAENFLLVEYNIPRGCLTSYYPETNTLIPFCPALPSTPTHPPPNQYP
jgi:anaerobic selenocysteine-containing dehydrogenase